jgi:pilus assembly protein Flp/PilA
MTSRTKKRIGGFAKDERGATAIEYSLIVGLIFLAIVTAVEAFASNTNVMYSEISSAMSE